MITKHFMSHFLEAGGYVTLTALLFRSATQIAASPDCCDLLPSLVAEDKGPRRTLVSSPPDMPTFVRRRGQARSTPPDSATLRPVPDVTGSAAKRRLLCGDSGHSSPSSVVASALLPSHKPRRLLLIWPLSPFPKGRPCSSAKSGRSGARSQKAHVSCLLAGARPRSVRCRDSETFALVRL